MSANAPDSDGTFFREGQGAHCPKNKANFRKYRGGSPLERKFTGDYRKLGIISSDYWEISPPGDFLPNTLGNLLCFWDSAETDLFL